MTTHTSRLRQIGWLVLLGACLAAFLALTFKVKSSSLSLNRICLHCVSKSQAWKRSIASKAAW